METKILDIDHVYIHQLKRGDKQAFNHLFHLYNKKLYYFARGYLKSGKEAEEIVQETFLKIWERRGYLEPELSFQAYLFKIAFNFIQKSLIKHVKDDALKHDLAGELINFDDHTSNMLNYHFLLLQINQLIDKLPPRQKEIFNLRKIEGYTVQEISEQLSLAIKTVEAHLTAALKFLRIKLQSDKIDDILLFAIIFKK